MSVLFPKIKEVLYAVLPVTFIVLILNFTLTPLDTPLLTRFLIGAALIIIGLAIFLVGVDIGITPIGNSMGARIAKTNKIWIVIILGSVLGFVISIAEPDLHILAGQVALVTSGVISKASIVVIVSVGIGILLSLGLVRIIFNIPLNKLLTVLYSIVFLLAILSSREFLAISFDASGATTGALTVPFILAVAAGVSALKKDSIAAEEDSFGLVAIASAGAIIAVLIMGIFSGTEELSGSLEIQESASALIFSPFLKSLPVVAKEILVALFPILLIFLVFQKVSLRLSSKSVRKILFGVCFTFIGLVLFLTGVNAGFLDVGRVVGKSMASLGNDAYIVIVGFILGLVTILAEPAVHVLTHQIEDVTSGYVKRSAVMFSLSVGVGFAVALSILRILVPGIQLWHYLLPGYLIAVGMSYFVPELFVGVAFDSGGVASGPMTATFILAFVQGVAQASTGASVLIDGFGMIAMVALTPLIALQTLGLIFKLKLRKTDLPVEAE